MPKHKQFSDEYASVFQDASVVAAYQFRPAYPPELFSILRGLLPTGGGPHTILDAGCGTGFVARMLAPFVDRVDAIDISPAMIAEGQALPGGDDPRLRWICAPLETAPFAPPYALIVAAASLHWMDWDVVLPRFAAALASGAVLALVEDEYTAEPWDDETSQILGRYSMNKDFVPYNLLTIANDLEHRGLFRRLGMRETAPVPFEQPVAAWIESFHARNGLSRDRMAPEDARAFDSALERVVRQYCPDGIVRTQAIGQVLWGTPLASAP